MKQKKMGVHMVVVAVQTGVKVWHGWCQGISGYSEDGGSSAAGMDRIVGIMVALFNSSDDNNLVVGKQNLGLFFFLTFIVCKGEFVFLNS